MVTLARQAANCGHLTPLEVGVSARVQDTSVAVSLPDQPRVQAWQAAHNDHLALLEVGGGVLTIPPCLTWMHSPPGMTSSALQHLRLPEVGRVQKKTPLLDLVEHDCRQVHA